MFLYNLLCTLLHCIIKSLVKCFILTKGCGALNDLYKLLKNKEILFILDGDTDFGEYNGRRIKMPYLSGPTICNISLTFGMSVEYSRSGGALSRWIYLENLMDYCIEQQKMPNLLSYLFSKEQFVDSLKGLPINEIDDTYNAIVKCIVNQISGILYFGGHELAIINHTFIVKPINSVVEIKAPVVKTIDHEYIKSLSERALIDIENSNYDSAITKCRTLLEEVFCYVIEKKGQTPSESGDIGTLYRQVKNLYNMHQDKEVDKRINMLLSGLEKIITSIAQMRNKDSDSHGVGSKRISISEHHARLYLNASIMMSDFILAVGNNQK